MAEDAIVSHQIRPITNGEANSVEGLVEEGFVNKRRKVIEVHEESDSSLSDDGSVENGGNDSSASVGNESKDDNFQKEDMFASDDDQQLSNVYNRQERADFRQDLQESSEGDEIKLEAFDLEEESKTGVFDKFGNYTETKTNAEDEIQDQDGWYDAFKGDEQVQKAKKSQEKMAKDQSLRREQLSDSKRVYTLEDALKRLQHFLNENETVLEALGRLNVIRTHYRKTKPRLKPSQKLMGEDNELHDKLCFQFVVHSINFLTDLLDIVGKKGIRDVNELTRVQVSSLLEEESLGDEPTNDYESKLWSFKWLRDLSTVNGPFTNYEMQSWRDTYFQDNVVVKYVDDNGDEARNWIHISCVHFM
ncbi:U5 snRNP complex subunit LIN1 LALA0_S11e02388g [Lachancea lanzarotensis]|uniref:LALA0S11e02388g1_1 n=1 Tax=Lachancea lanzarotensis TaxID=1245769 RepID=A0A0C7NF73_9SACH|nr:uncharacterized protein LALA0_S11e02388g [Lachancea lanzarotensis]CEP64363.1 LALA0S11e02388g1_1 [Lachancea lanzarotensis]